MVLEELILLKIDMLVMLRVVVVMKLQVELIMLKAHRAIESFNLDREALHLQRWVNAKICKINLSKDTGSHLNEKCCKLQAAIDSTLKTCPAK